MINKPKIIAQLRHHWDNCKCPECENLRIGSYSHDSHIYFIRHGHSVANGWERTLTPDWIVLSETWYQQAEKISKILVQQTPDKIRYSKYIRTQQTAKPTLLKSPNVAHEIFPHIHEKTYLDAEICANTNHAERRWMRDEYWEAWADYRHGTSAETFREFVARIDQTLEYIKNVWPWRLEYMFSHEMVMQWLLWRLQTSTYQVDDAYKTFAKNNRSKQKIENTQIVKFLIRDWIISILNSK